MADDASKLKPGLFPLGETMEQCLLDTGFLWLINRVVFHPRGYALAVDDDHPGRLFLMGDGTEPWWMLSKEAVETFKIAGLDAVDEDALFAQVNTTLAEAARHNGTY